MGLAAFILRPMIGDDITGEIIVGDVRDGQTPTIRCEKAAQDFGATMVDIGVATANPGAMD